MDSASPSSNGAVISGHDLILQSADATHPGLVNTATQSFTGNKTIFGTIAATNLSGNNTGDVTLTAVGVAPSANGASLSGQALTLQPADTTHPGVLTAADWNTFNNKQSALTIGNLTDGGTDGIIVTGGTGAVIGSGASLSQHVADTTHNGYLSSTDWNTFNGKQATVSIGALDAQAENVNGLAIVSGVLSTQSADATHPGVVNNTTQTFSGAKTFSSTIVGNITGNSATVTTNANLTGGVTSVGNAATVVTNANLTGPITSTGNATAVASQTGTGSIFVMQASPTLTTAVLGSSTATTQTQGDNSTKVATTAYVDTAITGLNPKTSCYVASTANIPGTYLNGVAGVGATFTITATGAFTVDGVSPPAASRFLLKDQTSGLQNGIYDVTVAGSIGVSPILTRSLDYNTAAEMNSSGLIPVINGTTNALSSWDQVATIVTVGTDPLVFSEFTANPSLYLLKANNLSDVASGSTSFNNISGFTTLGDTMYGGASGARSRLAGNITTTKKMLSQTGDGAASAAPTWSALVSGDIPNNAADTSGTATNATNVATTTKSDSVAYNLTFVSSNSTANQAVKVGPATYNPNTGVIAATNFTGAVTGTASGNTTYSASNHGVVLSSATNAMTVIAPDSSTAKVLVSGGSSADPAWSLLTNTNLSGSAAISNANLAAMAANTVKANVTGGSAVPTDVAITAAGTASAAVIRDSSANTVINNLTENLTSTASSAGTLTLTVASAGMQQITGTTTHTVVLPDCTTLAVGFDFEIFNRSTSAIIVNANGGGLIQLVESGNQVTVVCTNIGSAPGAWDSSYTVNGLTLGKVLALSMGMALN